MMSHNDNAKKLEVFRINRDFRTLPDNILQEMVSKAKRIFFKKGEFIFHAGDVTDCCYFVESGCVLLSKNSSTGKSITFLLLEKGASLNLVTCFKPCPTYFSARLLKNTKVLSIPRKDFTELVLQSPELTNNVICTLGELLDTAYHRMLDLVNLPAEQRIINILYIISDRLGGALPLTNNDLADLAGTSRETAARVIVKLQNSGMLLKSRGQITILNTSQLKSLSTSPLFLLNT
jgi:CRP-like cAMP-binding protein